MAFLLGLIGSLIGAGFGATAANNFALRRERKQEAMKLFLKIHKDIQDFKIALVRWATARESQAVLMMDGFNLELASKIDEATKDERKTYHDVHVLVSSLRSNCLGVGLLFERRGDSLGKAIAFLYILATDHITQFDSISNQNEIINPRIEAIEQAMKPLWKSFDDWTATDYG